jgi:hypothetical protein
MWSQKAELVPQGLLHLRDHGAGLVPALVLDRHLLGAHDRLHHIPGLALLVRHVLLADEAHHGVGLGLGPETGRR